MAAMTLRPAAPSLAMHRPGYASVTDADRAAREQAIVDREASLSERWRDPGAADATQTPKTAPTTPASDADGLYAEKLRRLENAWRT